MFVGQEDRHSGNTRIVSFYSSTLYIGREISDMVLLETYAKRPLDFFKHELHPEKNLALINRGLMDKGNTSQVSTRMTDFSIVCCCSSQKS